MLPRAASVDPRETAKRPQLGQDMVKPGSGPGPEGTAILGRGVCFGECFRGKELTRVFGFVVL